MRHQLSGRQLSRKSPHRWAMLRNMASSLLRCETIRTTVPKAKELRRYVEPLITLGKADSLANRQRAFAQLRDDEAVAKLFDELGPRFLSRPGGYTRILRMDPRPGDAAPMALMQLVELRSATAAPAPEADKPAAKAKRAARKSVKAAAGGESAPAEESAAGTGARPRARKAKAAAKTAKKSAGTSAKKTTKKAAKKSD